MQGHRASEASSVRETARQGAEGHGRDWSWVEASVWTERMLAALDNGVQGGKWYSLIDKVYRRQTLAAAWRRVAANAGAAGVDGQSVRRFAAHAESYLEELEQALKAGSYRPDAVKRVEIPKGAGKMRPLGIPVVKDRIVQTALKLVLEPIFEREFCESSYGFRPGRGCKDALREVDRLIKAGHTHVVDADLAGYFDSIPHERLMARVSERISDTRVLELLAAFVHQDVVKGLERWRPTSGTPQGAVISPLLANLYLHPLDCVLRERGYRVVRYADDFVVLCESAQQAQAALREVQAWVKENGLSLNAEKTHVGDCRCEGEGFEFLGYRFEAGRRSVRRKSLGNLHERIRAKTGRNSGLSLREIITQLNPILRGWFRYFQHVTMPEVFQSVDGFTRRRLRAILCRRNKRPQFGHSLWASQHWPNSFFAEQGLFTLVQAYAQARQPR
jgi:RNA-directed DNA polymerase